MLMFKLFSEIFLLSLCLICSNPYFLIIILFLSSLLMIFNLAMILITQWFSLIIFLVFIGGLLVMFLYLITLVEKESYNLSFWKMFLALTIFYFSPSFPLMSHFSNLSNPGLLFSYVGLSFFGILFLLFTLFSVTTLIKLKEGPLRLI